MQEVFKLSTNRSVYTPVLESHLKRWAKINQ